jgi:hypothetical protein
VNRLIKKEDQSDQHWENGMASSEIFFLTGTVFERGTVFVRHWDLQAGKRHDAIY